jgi:AcrR family transcriptional regulator
VAPLSPRVKISAPVRERRSHAERTAETRERVMAAVVETISEVGFNRATAAEISRRAGVTWGAVQHHFGDKDGILMAVLEESFHRFAEILGEVSQAEALQAEDLEKRVAMFVERSWIHFSSPHYRTTFEILLNLPDEIELPWQREMLREWHRIWSGYFPESNPSNQATIEVMLYAVSVLTGLATTQMLEAKPVRTRERELGFLKETLVKQIERQLAS